MIVFEMDIRLFKLKKNRENQDVPFFFVMLFSSYFLVLDKDAET